MGFFDLFKKKKVEPQVAPDATAEDIAKEQERIETEIKQEIEARWSEDVERFKQQRRPYLLYQE